VCLWAPRGESNVPREMAMHATCASPAVAVGLLLYETIFPVLLFLRASTARPAGRGIIVKVEPDTAGVTERDQGTDKKSVTF